jgi:hypothetical protein
MKLLKVEYFSNVVCLCSLINVGRRHQMTSRSFEMCIRLHAVLSRYWQLHAYLTSRAGSRILAILFSSRAYADTTFVVRGVGALECYKWALVAGRARQDAACEPTWPDFVGRFWGCRYTKAHLSSDWGEVGWRVPHWRKPCVRGVTL